MATHSSVFAWRIPWTEEPGGLQSMGSQRVGHELATNTFTFPWWLIGKEFTHQHRRCGFNLWVGKIPWRRKWHSIPVYLPRKSSGERSLESYSPWGHRESDLT